MKKIPLILSFTLLLGVAACKKEENSSPPPFSSTIEAPAEFEPVADEAPTEPSDDTIEKDDPTIKEPDSKPTADKDPTKGTEASEVGEAGASTTAEKPSEPGAPSEKDKEGTGKTSDKDKSAPSPTDKVSKTLWHSHPQPDLANQILFDGVNFVGFSMKDSKVVYDSTDARTWQPDPQSDSFLLKVLDQTIYLFKTDKSSKEEKAYRRVDRGNWALDASAQGYVFSLHVPKKAGGPYYNFTAFSSQLNLAEPTKLVYPEPPSGYAKTDWSEGTKVHSQGGELFFPGVFSNTAGTQAALYRAKIGEAALTDLPFPKDGEKLAGFRIDSLASKNDLYLATTITHAMTSDRELRLYRSKDARTWTYAGPIDKLDGKGNFSIAFSKFVGDRFLLGVNKQSTTDMARTECLVVLSSDLVHFEVETFENYVCQDGFSKAGAYYVLAYEQPSFGTVILSTVP